VIPRLRAGKIETRVALDHDRRHAAVLNALFQVCQRVFDVTQTGIDHCRAHEIDGLSLRPVEDLIEKASCFLLLAGRGIRMAQRPYDPR
jgi:hypothetical protein